MKTVGVVGLGLIGGSFAKAYHADGGWKVLAHDRDEAILGIAELGGEIDGRLTKENIGSCDLILIALYPEASVAYLEEMAPHISKNAIVIDGCGIKRFVCERCFPIAKKHGFTFLGGHPMAGRHFSGYKYSTKTLFKDASMVIVPEHFEGSADMELVSKVKELLKPAGFGRITISTPQQHDAMIAFTSQLAHVVSNAYVKSPTARSHKGFSAGSYKDLTRVAWLNEDMWTELFLENGDNLVKELDTIIGNLTKYRDAIAQNDAATLHDLLAEGKHCKEEIDGKFAR
ncbi:MAG: prephenate dehydrogenase [Lachnospiraceae bacterium]|nr:prephenate dehydrogenase [Lachnospiraceae bacterium]